MLAAIDESIEALGLLRFLTVHAAKQTELLTEIRDRLPKPQTTHVPTFAVPQKEPQ